jgi:hypothetical protein
LAKPRDHPDRDPSPYVGLAPPPNNLDSNGEDNLLNLPEEVGELIEERVDASEDESAERKFYLDLWHEAEDEVKDTMAQFQIDNTKVDEIIELFQNDMTASSSDLRIKSIPGKTIIHGEF